MDGFLRIENCLFYNHLMHGPLNFKMHKFLFISLFKHVDQDEWNVSSNIFVYSHIYRWA